MAEGLNVEKQVLVEAYSVGGCGSVEVITQLLLGMAFVPPHARGIALYFGDCAGD